MGASSAIVAGPDRPRYGAHWTIFLPALAVGVLCGASWLVLSALGGGDTGLARVLLILTVIGAPLIFVHAYLRYASLGLLIGGNAVWVRQGWFRPKWRRLALADMDDARAAPGLAGRMFGGGALVFRFKDGRRVALDDLAGAEEAARLIGQRLRGARTARRPG